MKNLNILFKHLIVALIMVVLSGVGASASTPWTVNPSDYRYDMSVYFNVFFGDDKPDYGRYEVAAFYGDECRGIAEVLPLGNGNECLYLRARSNQERGETLTFKYHDMATGEVVPIENATFTFESNGRLGYPSDPCIVRIVKYHQVTLTAGTGGRLNTESGSYEEGTELSVTAIPEAGYRFSKWSDGRTENPRTVIVDGDISLTAIFEAVKSYKLTYILDGSLYKEVEVEEKSPVIPEPAPEKEGHTFSGWEGLPETMPAHDVTVTGAFTVNSYNAVFKIGDEVIETKTVLFGEAVEAPVVPEKEGHTFAGWEGLPETMPAHDVEIFGSYTVNLYKLTLYLNNQVYSSEEVEFGTALHIEEPNVPEGNKFDGWTTEIPETMPPHDLDIYGTYSNISSVEPIGVDGREGVTIYSISGISVRSESKTGGGIYIVNGRMVMVK